MTQDTLNTLSTHKQYIRVLFFPSDNSSSSGAFLSMAKLANLLKQGYDVKPLIVLPNQGDGQIILDDYDLPYVYIHSYSWVVSIVENRPSKEKIIESVKDCIRIIRALLLTPVSILQICRLIKKYKPNIVHINTSWGFAGAIAAFHMNVPVVWHIREFLEEGQLKKIAFREAGYRLMRKSKKLVTISYALAKKYQKIFSDNKLVTIYNGIDIDSFYQKKREGILNNNKIYLLCVGELYSGKGQDQIIQALSKLQTSGINNFVMHFLGKGINENYYKNLCSSLSLTDKVVFDGYQSDIKKYYQSADILLMASKSEAFGRVTVEAMLSGCLIIGAASGGTPEVLNYGKCGFLYEPGNIDDLCLKIRYVNANRSVAREVAERGQEFARVKFSADVNAKTVYKLYNEVLGESDV